jgi:hypothetical protein
MYDAMVPNISADRSMTPELRTDVTEIASEQFSK